jgi:Domain of unknown function (DUF4268)
MYTKEQVSKIRQKFWTTFGQYMKPVPRAAGEKVNWLNYKTGIRHVVFRMDADQQKAIVAIELRHETEAERMHYYHHFAALKKILENTTGNQWHWQASTTDENRQTISRISQELHQVNVLNETNWPAIIAFLKPRIIALDAFWEMVKDGFD